MAKRDFTKEPYTNCEKRIVRYIQEATGGQLGGGDDPVGFLIASHRVLQTWYREQSEKR